MISLYSSSSYIYLRKIKGPFIHRERELNESNIHKYIMRALSMYISFIGLNKRVSIYGFYKHQKELRTLFSFFSYRILEWDSYWSRLYYIYSWSTTQMDWTPQFCIYLTTRKWCFIPIKTPKKGERNFLLYIGPASAVSTI